MQKDENLEENKRKNERLEEIANDHRRTVAHFQEKYESILNNLDFTMHAYLSEEFKENPEDNEYRMTVQLYYLSIYEAEPELVTKIREEVLPKEENGLPIDIVDEGSYFEDLYWRALIL